MFIVCAAIPNFRLRAAVGRRYDPDLALGLFSGPGRQARLLEVSPAAAEEGVAVGMQMSQSLARCSRLRPVALNPVRAGEIWTAVCKRLEGLGATVECSTPGEAYFVADGLTGLFGGTLDGVLAGAARAMGPAFDLGAAPSCYGASLAAAAAGRMKLEDPLVVAPPDLLSFLGGHPVAVLRGRLDAGEGEEAGFVESLENLGVETLAQLVRIGPDQVADRFGGIGLRALRLARGEDGTLRPTAPQEDLHALMELPDGTAGELLDRALEIVVARLLADPERKARTILALRLSAPLIGGGGWTAEQTFGRPTASPKTIASLMRRCLEGLPQPASALDLRVLTFGPPTSDQLEMRLIGEESRHRRLAGAIREVRAAAGPDALLRISDADAASRVPERRFFLSPRLDS